MFRIISLLKFHPSRLKLAGVLLVLFFVAGAMFMPVPSVAGLGDSLASLLSSIVLAFAKFLGELTLVLIDILIHIASYNDFINAPAVIKGWVIVRDLCNMFFIVALLTMAFGTIFRVEEYQFNHLLGKLLLMAVLINFSKSITGAIIDIAQVVTLTFVNGFKEAAAGNFVKGFHLQDMFDFAGKGGGALGGKDLNGPELFTASILAFVTIAITTIVVGVYVVIFLIRIVALWLLTVMSPAAYLLSAFPGEKAHEYSHEWWEYFGKYVSSGPILAFFLWLSLAVMQFSNNSIANFVEKEQTAISITNIGQSDVLLSFLINIALLVFGLFMAEHMGVVGGGLAGSALHMMQNAGKKIAKSPISMATWGSRKLYKKTGVDLNPMNYLRAWKAHAERKKHEELAEGGKKAAEKASEAFHKGQGRRGMLRMALGAQRDFLDAYTGIQGFKRLGKTLVKPRTGMKALEEAEGERELSVLDSIRAHAHRGKEYEIEKGKEKARNIEEDKLFKEKIDEARKKRESGNVDYNKRKYTETGEDGKLKPIEESFDGYLAKKGIVRSDLTSSDPIKADEARRLFDSWDKEKAQTDREKDINFDDLVDTRVSSGYSDDDFRKLGKDDIQNNKKQAEKELDYLVNGGLSSEQIFTREKRIQGVEEQIITLGKNIVEKKSRGEKVDDLEKLSDELKESLIQLTKKDANGFYVVPDAEKNNNKALNGNIISAKRKELAGFEGSLLTEEEAKNFEVSSAEHKKKAGKYQVAPQAYYALQEWRHVEHEEASKLPKEPMEYTELHEQIERAIKDRDYVKIHVLMKKAAEDYNDNEVWNGFGYAGGYDGIKKFTHEMLVPIMGHEGAYGLINEIAYINEDRGHYNASRLIKMKAGGLMFRDPYEHAAAVANENIKKDLRKWFQSTNRLGPGFENPDGSYRVDLSGKLTYALGQDDMAYRLGRAEFNKSHLSKLIEDIGTIRKLQKEGILTAKVRMEDGSTLTLANAIIRQAQREKDRGVGTNYEAWRKLAVYLDPGRNTGHSH